MAPYVGDAVERYLEADVEIAPRLGAEWIVMHAGFHFTSDKERRMTAGLERLKKLCKSQRPVIMIKYVRGRIGADGLGDEAADIGDAMV
jgi:endonuclease IV